MKSRVLGSGIIRVWEGNPAKAYAFAEGYVNDNGKLVILNIEVDNVLRRQGLGRGLINELKKITGTNKLVVDNIQEGSEEFWNKIRS